jgi:hypothetical protein
MKQLRPSTLFFLEEEEAFISIKLYMASDISVFFKLICDGKHFAKRRKEEYFTLLNKPLNHIWNNKGPKYNLEEQQTTD